VSKSRISLAVLGLSAALSGCAATTHPAVPSSLGVPIRSAELLAVLDEPGTTTVETVASADWSVELSGLLNLDHPKAVAAGLSDRDEPIQIYFHAIRHPREGLYIVDTGVEKALRDDPEQAAIRGVVAYGMHTDRMRFLAPLGPWLGAQKAPLQGVFFTHLHLDHISGLRDVPRGTALFSGPGETAASDVLYALIQGTADREFEGQASLQEWRFQPDADERFDGVLDIFGDRQVFALSVPGHTPGSTAYLARTTTGPVLMVGDTCHTAWGWQNGVEPGGFTADHPKNAESLERLRTLAKEHPRMRVLLGHQRLPAAKAP
jgi:N-acyl homoserine lactone hydrolase